MLTALLPLYSNLWVVMFDASAVSFFLFARGIAIYSDGIEQSMLLPQLCQEAAILAETMGISPSYLKHLSFGLSGGEDIMIYTHTHLSCLIKKVAFTHK